MAYIILLKMFDILLYFCKFKGGLINKIWNFYKKKSLNID